MKKNVLKVMQAFLLIFLFALVLVSCQKDSDSDSFPVVHEEMLSENSADSSSQSLFSEMATIVPFKVDEGEVFAFSATSRAALNNSNEYDVVPKFGRTKSTVHVFKASVNKADSEQVYLKLYNKASGAIQYFPMVQASSVNYQLNLRINQNGWYDYRYVIGDKAGRILKNVSNSPARTLCSTYNIFDKDGVSHITWPFGADGSSWTKRTVNGQTWKGGADEEPLTGPGYGHNEGTHTGITERFSEDWNRGSKSYDDFNLEIRSPLDGVIERVDSYYVQNHGRSHFVSVVQEDENGNKFRFYVAHLNTTIPRSYVGRYVRAGVDKLGTLGKSGASSPHAHCNLRFGVGYQKPSIQFRFDAIKGGLDSLAIYSIIPIITRRYYLLVFLIFLYLKIMGILTFFLGFIFHFSALYSFHTSSTEKVVDVLTVRSLTGAILKYPVKILGTGGQISTLSGQDFSFSGNFAVRLPRLPQKVYLGYNTAYRIDFVDSGLFAYMRTPSQNIGNPELREFGSFEAICLHNDAREATPDKIKRQKVSKDGTQVSLFSLDWRYPTIVGEELIGEQQYIFSKEFIACYQKGDWLHRLSLEGVTQQEGQNFYDSLKIF